MIGIVLIAVFSMFLLRIVLVERINVGDVTVCRGGSCGLWWHSPALSRLLWACVICNRRLGPATTLGCVRVFPPSTRFQEWGNYTTSGINAIQIIVMSNVYRTMARKLTDFGAESRILCFVRGGGVEGLGGACRRRAGSRYCPRFVFV